MLRERKTRFTLGTDVGAHEQGKTLLVSDRGKRRGKAYPALPRRSITASRLIKRKKGGRMERVGPAEERRKGGGSLPLSQEKEEMCNFRDDQTRGTGTVLSAKGKGERSP